MGITYMHTLSKKITSFATFLLLTIFFPALAFANDNHNNGGKCDQLPSYNDLKSALLLVAPDSTNGGLNHQMWGTIVNRDGVVCAIARTGSDRGDQWPGSRVISAQKANTANAFSLPGLALSTANLFSAVQPGGSLFGLQDSNPVDTKVAYRGNSGRYGTRNDPMVGGKIGGVNVFGGGLALYNSEGELVGAIGVSGDTSCADHNVAWRTRYLLKFDYVPAGVATNSDDDIIFDITANPAGGVGISDSGYGHAECFNTVTPLSNTFPTSSL